jgi:aspartate/methionine/tyrosine aminotransferase
MHAGYQSLYEVAASRGATVKRWEPRYRVLEGQADTHEHNSVEAGAGAAAPPTPSTADPTGDPTGDLGRLQFHVEDLRKLACEGGGRVAMIVVNFPHNPTGACLSGAQLRAVAEVARNCGAWLFSDEMYRGLGVHLYPRVHACTRERPPHSQATCRA